MRIYVTEDSPTQTLRLKRILSRLPDTTLEFFADGLQAYLAIQLQPPDLLLLDVILPTLNGLALCRLLKFSELYRDVPVLIMTSIAEPDIEERARAVGADGFLAKPFGEAGLLEQVELLCSSDGSDSLPEEDHETARVR